MPQQRTDKYTNYTNILIFFITDLFYKIKSRFGNQKLCL